MAKSRKANPTPNTETAISDIRHSERKRTNIPPAGLASQGVMEPTPKQRFYYYDPHLPPLRRFDDTGAVDNLPILLEKKQPVNL